MGDKQLLIVRLATATLGTAVIAASIVYMRGRHLDLLDLALIGLSAGPFFLYVGAIGTRLGTWAIGIMLLVATGGAYAHVLTSRSSTAALGVLTSAPINYTIAVSGILIDALLLRRHAKREARVRTSLAWKLGGVGAVSLLGVVVWVGISAISQEDSPWSDIRYKLMMYGLSFLLGFVASLRRPWLWGFPLVVWQPVAFLFTSLEPARFTLLALVSVLGIAMACGVASLLGAGARSFLDRTVAGVAGRSSKARPGLDAPPVQKSGSQPPLG